MLAKQITKIFKRGRIALSTKSPRKRPAKAISYVTKGDITLIFCHIILKLKKYVISYVTKGE